MYIYLSIHECVCSHVSGKMVIVHLPKHKKRYIEFVDMHADNECIINIPRDH